MNPPQRYVRLFRNGRNQALRIPRELELEGGEAVVRKEGDRLIVEPVRKGRLLALLSTWEPIPDEFPDVDEDLLALDDVERSVRTLTLRYLLDTNVISDLVRSASAPSRDPSCPSLRGTPIGSNHLLIAAHALSDGLVIVSANVREFARVPGLGVENWLAD